MIIHCKRLNSYIWPIDETQTDTPTQDKNGPDRNSNEGGSLDCPKLQNWSLTLRWFIVIS